MLGKYWGIPCHEEGDAAFVERLDEWDIPTEAAKRSQRRGSQILCWVRQEEAKAEGGHDQRADNGEREAHVLANSSGEYKLLRSYFPAVISAMFLSSLRYSFLALKVTLVCRSSSISATSVSRTSSLCDIASSDAARKARPRRQ